MSRRVQQQADGKSRKGCLFGCLGTVIGVPVLLVLLGYYLVMHSSLPLRLVAQAIEQDESNTIKGIGGSISRGFTVESIRSIDDSGNESILEGLTLQWGDINRMRKNRELVIEEIGLRRAHIFVDSDEAESESSKADPGDTSGSGKSLKLFEIKKVDIRKVVIESTTGEFKLELDQILMEGLRIQDNDLDLAALSVGSNFIDLELEDAEEATIAGEKIPFTRRLVGVLKPDMHEAIVKEIDFTVELGAIAGEVVTRIRACDGALENTNLGKDGHQAMTMKAFTPADYFAAEEAGPVGELSLSIRRGETAPQTGLRPVLLESGSLTLGSTPFTMAPQLLGETEAKLSDVDARIVATSKRGGLEITATLGETEEPPFVLVELSSEPAREQKEIIALLWFGKPHAELTQAEATRVDAIEQRHFP